MSQDDRREDELSRLLASVHADADPTVWTRARARIEARERQRATGWLAWVMRPAALGASLAVFVAAVGTSMALLATAPQELALDQADDLTDALVSALSMTTETAAPAATSPAPVSDSGGVR
jgi:hypothetical protein